MQTFVKFILWLVVFFVTSLIAGANPLNIVPVFYYVPLFFMTYHFIKPKEVEAKGLLSNPKYLNLIKSLLGLIAVIIATGLKLPFLDKINGVLEGLIGNWDKLDEAVTFLFSFALSIYAILAGKDSILGTTSNKIEKLEMKFNRESKASEKYLQ